jgi:beta-propeller uncharacterized protein DUF5122
MRNLLFCCLLVVGCTHQPGECEDRCPDGASPDAQSPVDGVDMAAPVDMAMAAPVDMAMAVPVDMAMAPPPDMTMPAPSLTWPGFDGAITAIVHAGTSYYVGGRFTRVSPYLAPNILALDASGTPTTCPLGAGFDGLVEAIVQANGSIYVGGEFTHYQGKLVNGLAKIDASTCALDTTFSPPASNGFNGIVLALAVSDSSLYVGGLFTAYRGVAGSTNAIAKLDLTTGALDTTFSPPAPASNGFGGISSSQVTSLAVAGSSLYVGGWFTAYRGVAGSANYIAKLDLASGAIDTSFSPVGNNGFSYGVSSLAVAGSSLYAAGFFTAYRGVANSANGLAKLDLASGAIDTTFSPVGANGVSPASVYALAVYNSSLFVGGDFNAYQKGGTSQVGKLAKLDLASGALDTTFLGNGALSGRVESLAISGSALYVGGQFTAYQGVPDSADHLARLDAGSGMLDTTFVPSGSKANGLGYNAEVRALAIVGSTLWVGGMFKVYAGYPVNNLAKLDDTTLAVDTTFSPAAANGFSSSVNALAVSGSSLYVGGSFIYYRGLSQSANCLAKLDLVSGDLDTTFSPPGANGVSVPYPAQASVRALAVSGSSLYVGGLFSAYRGVANSANGIAKLDLASGTLDTTFSPPGATSNGFDANSHVDALAVAGSSLYVGGNFTAYEGVANSANGIAKLDLASGALDTTFSPPGAGQNGFDTARGPVYALAVAGGALYAGGQFSAYRGVTNSANALAKLDLMSGAIDTTFSPVGANSNGFIPISPYVAVLALTVAGSSLYVGGWELTGYRGVANSANSLAKLDLVSGAIDTTFSPVGANGNGFGTGDSVWSFAAAGGALVIGGNLTIYRGAGALENFARVDLDSGILK